MFGGKDRQLTLGELRRTGRVVHCLCRRCRHENNLATKLLIARAGAATKVTYAANFLRCSRCGSKNVWTMPGERPRHPYRMPPAPER